MPDAKYTDPGPEMETGSSYVPGKNTVHAPKVVGIVHPGSGRAFWTRSGIGGNQIASFAGVTVTAACQASTAVAPDPGYCLPASAGTAAPIIVVADAYLPLSVAWASPILAQGVATDVLRPGPANVRGVDGDVPPHAR